MLGTWINIGAIILGSMIGLLLGGRLPERFKQTVIAALGDRPERMTVIDATEAAALDAVRGFSA